MQMDEGLDTGAVLAQAELPLHPPRVLQNFRNPSPRLGAELLSENLNDLAQWAG